MWGIPNSKHMLPWSMYIFGCGERNTSYAVLVGGSNVDVAYRSLVPIFELIDPCPYENQPSVYGRLIYTVIHMSDRLLTQENPNLHLTPPPDLRSAAPGAGGRYTMRQQSDVYKGRRGGAKVGRCRLTL